MDDLLNEFLTETRENLEHLDMEIVRLEQDPQPELLSSIFRMMHTIKGTCGFLSLPRLEHVAHAAENVLGRIRDGELGISPQAVSMILEAIDQIKFIVAVLEESGHEPEGDDTALIAALNALAAGTIEGDVEGAAPVPSAVSPVVAPVVADMPVPDAVDAASFAVTDAPVAAAPAAPSPRTAASHPAAPRDEPKSDTARKDKDSGQTIRVNVDLLENLMNMVSELVLTRNQMLQIARNRNQDELTVPLQRLSHVTSELQEGVMKTRMQPIGNAWNKLPRLIRDLSIELNKKIDLVMAGEDTELDRQVLEMIKDPLTHMVRNSADHGIEMPQERIRAGKSDTGVIRLEALHEGGHIIIRISDDGKGLCLDKIRDKVLRNGLATADELAEMSLSQIQQFIFKPGFSTAAQVTSVSGRGVGMDVVRTNIEKIGGTIELTSEEGRGSTFVIKIPLTLAIVSALIVGVGRERFAIPQLSVVELVRVNSTSEHRIETVHGAPVLRLRGRLLPLVSLRQALDLEDIHPHDNRSTFIVVTQVGAYSFGMIVDKVFDTEEIVVKPVAPILKNISLFSGNTILGDGSVIMILDPNGVAAKTGEMNVGEPATAETGWHGIDGSNDERVSLLVFSAGGKTPRAVPLALVARLEEVDVKDIEYGNGRPLVQYRGALMPLVTLSPDYAIKPEGLHPVLVFADGKRAMGMIVDEIIDIVSETITINLPAADQRGLIGSAIIRGHATDLIDAHHYINHAFADWFRKTESSSDANRPHAKKRLLLVDDSAFFRNLLTPVLQVAGYQVTTAENPVQALRLREAGETFDLIISDIEMPEMDGFAFAEKVRADTLWGDLPLVALSGHANPEDMSKGHAVGFDDYVAKFDRDALLHTIRGIFGEMPLPV